MSDDLAAISEQTLAHYERNASTFREGTADHDVSQNYAALLSHITASAPFTLLDFGCGPGRDLAYFASLGHRAIGLDGCAAFCTMARVHSRCPVLQQDFLGLDLPAECFDGIFANASLFHVPTSELPRVLVTLHQALRPGGVLFCSNPRGDDSEGWHQGRYGAYHSLDGWRAYMSAFTELDHFYRPTGKPRAEQPWLATVWRR